MLMALALAGVSDALLAMTVSNSVALPPPVGVIESTPAATEAV